MVEPNPYAASASSGYGGSPLPLGSTAMVNQIRVVAILTIVHGALACAAGLMYVALGVVTLFLVPTMHENPPGGGFAGDSGPPTWIFLIYVAMGLPAVIIGAVQIFAGWRNYDLRNRTLGIVAVLGGVVASTTCYCAPTAIALTVYGLIVLLNSGVAQAFAWRAEGATAHEVLARIYQPFAAPQARPTATIAWPQSNPSEQIPPASDPPGAEEPPAGPPTKPFPPTS